MTREGAYLVVRNNDDVVTKVIRIADISSLVREDYTTPPTSVRRGNRYEEVPGVVIRVTKVGLTTGSSPVVRADLGVIHALMLGRDMRQTRNND